MNQYEPILKEIASGFLDQHGIKPNFSNEAFLDACLIFQTALMDKLFDLQNEDNMLMKQRGEMATKCGEDLRKLIHTYTGLDTFELVK